MLTLCVKNPPQLIPVHISKPIFTDTHAKIGQLLFGFYHLVYFLLKAVFGDEAIHRNISLLTDSKGSICGLVLYSRVEP